jgi:carboxyl-terminal processing protease
METLKRFCVVATLLIIFSSTYAQPGIDPRKKSDPSDKFNEVMSLVRNYYTDTVNEEKITEDAIRKAMEDLDPHSSYTPASDVKKANESLVGNFEGIGITFQLLNDTIMVLEVIPGGPSEKVGLQAGDKIVKVNDSTVAGIKIGNDGVIKKLRGPKGTKVNIAIMRGGERNLLDFTIIRDKIPIYSVTASYMAEPGIGYIRFERFAATTLQEFSQAVEKLREQGMKDLILDMQGNIGGYLYTAVDMCNQFLGDNQLIVYTQGLHAPYQPYFSNGKGFLQQGKVVVMIDEGSASAAEILSGCMQDNDRALLVGRRTFGKGLVQKPFTLSDGSEVKITTAHYYTPSGRCIQKPFDSYKDDYKNRYESGELFGRDTFKFIDSLRKQTLNGRNVYGGGGIEPDFYVPIDTSMSSALFNQLIRKGVENKFCLEYVDKNRGKFSKIYASADSFYQNFNVDTNLLSQYMAQAVTDSAIKLIPGSRPTCFSDYFSQVKNDSLINFKKDYEKSKKVIEARLKASIGRNLFDVSMYYRVINASVNDVYAKAIDVINNNKLFDELKPKPAKNEKGKGKSDKPKNKVTSSTNEMNPAKMPGQR